MTDYTTAEIDSAVEVALEGWSELGYMSKGYKETIALRGEPVEIETVAGKAPEEGGGEHVFVIIKAGDQFFRKTGYYMSHYGSDWDGDVTEVHPVEKTITVYEAK